MNVLLQTFTVVFLIKYVSGEADLISYGKPVKRFKFPFFVQLIAEETSSDDRTEVFHCGATLIHPQFVLTAAHCFNGIIDTNHKILTGYYIGAYVGSNRIYDRDNSLTARCIKKVILHPRYIFRQPRSCDMPNYYIRNDIALGKLNSRFPLSHYVQIIKLPDSSDRCCLTGSILGREKRKKTCKIVEYSPVHRKCQKEISLAPEYGCSQTVFFTEVESLENLKFIGESGGPFVCFYFKAEPVQFGVLSNFYNNTETDTTIAIYESVDKHKRFIRKYIPLLP